MKKSYVCFSRRITYITSNRKNTLQDPSCNQTTLAGNQGATFPRIKKIRSRNLSTLINGSDEISKANPAGTLSSTAEKGWNALTIRFLTSIRAFPPISALNRVLKEEVDLFFIPTPCASIHVFCFFPPSFYSEQG